MALSSDLASLFVKTTKDDRKSKNESTVYGTVIVQGGETWVKLDGSDLLTPFKTTTTVTDGERVTVMVKNHTAVVTGNTTSPSAKNATVVELEGKVGQFDSIYAKKGEFDTLIAENATIKNLQADKANIKDLEATNATIENLQADKANIKDLEATNATIEKLQADKANIKDLEATNATIEKLDADVADIEKAYIAKADVERLMATHANITFENVDFANIYKAKFGEFYANSGIIKDYASQNGVVTGKLVAVEIDADDIKSGTLAAERLMLKGDNGVFYQLNVNALGETTVSELPPDEQAKLKEGIHGKSIIAKTITADSIAVSDLVAFDATIGGFKIGDDSIHTYAKTTADNSTRGIYLDSTGQINVGDAFNHIKYYKDTDGKWRLAIAAQDIRLAASGKSIDDLVDGVQIGARNLVRNSTDLLFKDYDFRNLATPFSATVTNNVLTVTGGDGAPSIDNGALVVTGSASAYVVNNILEIR